MKYIELDEAIKIHDEIINEIGGFSLGMHFLELDNKYSKKFAIEMEEIVVNVANDNISKKELKKILNDFIANNAKV